MTEWANRRWSLVHKDWTCTNIHIQIKPQEQFIEMTWTRPKPKTEAKKADQAPKSKNKNSKTKAKKADQAPKNKNKKDKGKGQKGKGKNGKGKGEGKHGKGKGGKGKA